MRFNYSEGSMDRPRLLLVDDDEKLRSLLRRYLEDQGFSVEGVGTPKEMDRVLVQKPFDLMVLDLMLPEEDGLSICRRLRAIDNHIPILMLTAKGDEVDRIVGLEFGADDYLPKPCNPRELAARIKAVLRRQPPALAAAPKPGGEEIRFGPFCLNLETRTLSKDGQAISLTSGEFALLRVFVENPFKPLSRDQLMVKARGREYDAFDRSIDVQVSRLRKQIEGKGAKGRYIQTVWGEGYVFVPTGEPR